MSINQSNYFSVKRPWSETKDDLLACYLTPFFTKVYNASRDGIVYVDAFAGPGRFGDGCFGSPLIAMQKYKEVGRTKRYKTPIAFVFAEADAASNQQLRASAAKAIGRAGYMKSRIHSTFDEAMLEANKMRLVGGRIPSTYFYYVDPFGVKDLRLAPLLDSPNFSHTEALVNFNSTGFIRDGLCALKLASDAPEEVEYADSPFDESTPLAERIDRLNAAFGGDEWIPILQSRNAGEYDYWQAEKLISAAFCENARKRYAYVLNMPIKDMTKRVGCGGLIKYRLVFMTNSPDGCVIMNNNMVKRNEDKQVLQGSLFKVDVDGADVDSRAVSAAMLEAVTRRAIGERVTLAQLLADVVVRCGVFDRSNPILRTYLGPLIDDGIVERVKKYTPTGKVCSSFSEAVEVYRAR